MNFRKTFYVLPNLFTLSSVLCGFVSLALSASAPSEANFYLAAIAIVFGLFFDTFDGRVARMTKTQSELGRELDSLADVITFGAATALMVYKWALTSFGRLGIFIAGLYVCAGALRLARFNVLSQRDEAAGQKKPGKYTVGLSIPLAASVLVLMVIVSHNAGQYRIVSEGSTAVIVVVLSALMVSRVRFRSFKDLRPNRKTIATVILLFGGIAAVWIAGLEKALTLLVLVCAYIALGLTEELVLRSRSAVERVRERAQGQTDAAEQARARAEEHAEDQEVLRELGAFDGDPPAGAADEPPSSTSTKIP